MKQPWTWLFFPVIFCLLVLGVDGARPSPALAGAPGWSAVQNLTPRITSEAVEFRDPDVYASYDGTVHVVYRGKGILYKRSEDRGRTWSEPVLASGERLVNGAPTVLVDRDGIHIVWPSLVVTPLHTHYQLFYVRSQDQGRSWTEPEMLTATESHSSEPALLRSESGIAVIWYELDEKSLPFKERLTTDILTQFFENPLQGVVPREYLNVLRSTILIKQSSSGGRSWTDSDLIAEVLNPLQIFFPYQAGDNAFGVYWSEEGKIYNYFSPDGGITWRWEWRYDPYLSPTQLNQLVYTPEGVVLIGIPRKPFELLRIRQWDLNTMEPTYVSDPVYFRSPPRVAYGGDEIHVVWAVRDEAQTWVAYQRTDGVPPRTRITEPAERSVTSESFKVAWEGADDISQRLAYSHLKYFDTDEWTPFEPGQFVVLKTPADGEYVFKVRARDEAGNIEPTPAEFAFETYGVPPNTVLEQKPPGQVRSRSVQVAWSGYDNTVTDPADLFYSYRLDDSEWSPFGKVRQQTFRDLLEGPHVFQVRSRDNRGNIDPSPADARFDVVVGIEVAFKTPPPSDLNEPRLRLAWVGSDRTEDNVPLVYSYRLDGGPWSEWSITDSIALEPIEEGRHQIEIRARDAIGNESAQPLVHSVAIDLTPPQTEADLAEVVKENNYAPIISLGGTDNLSEQEQLRFEYRIGDAPWSEVARDRTVTLPAGLSPWSPGYVVEVRAKDSVGNVDPTPSLINLRFPGRYLRYGMGRLAVPVVYPIVFVLIVLLILAGFAGLVFLLVARRRKPAVEVAEEFAGEAEAPVPARATSAFEDEDDFFESPSTPSSSETEIKFDEEDDLFS